MTHDQIHAMVLWHDKALLPWSLALHHALTAEVAAYLRYWRR
jgi:hypothetical protein